MSSAFEVLVKYGEDQGIEAERISSILLNGLEKEEPLVTFAIGNGGRQAPEVAAARPVLPRTWSMSRSQKSRENGGGWNSSHEVISMKLPVRCWTFSLRSTPVVIALLNWLVMWLYKSSRVGPRLVAACHGQFSPHERAQARRVVCCLSRNGFRQSRSFSGSRSWSLAGKALEIGVKGATLVAKLPKFFAMKVCACGMGWQWQP